MSATVHLMSIVLLATVAVRPSLSQGRLRYVIRQVPLALIKSRYFPFPFPILSLLVNHTQAALNV